MSRKEIVTYNMSLALSPRPGSTHTHTHTHIYTDTVHINTLIEDEVAKK